MGANILVNQIYVQINIKILGGIYFDGIQNDGKPKLDYRILVSRKR
jgi:hypothetical protein